MKKETVLFSGSLDGTIKLIKNAADRLSDHFIDYIKVYLVGIGLLILLGIAFTIVSLGFFAIAKITHIALLYLLVIPLLLAFSCFLIYIVSWCGLVSIDSIIGKTNMPVKQRFIALRSKVIGFIWLQAFLGIFTFGLLPLGILSVGTVFIFWTVSGLFTTFIYLEHQEKGLQNLWTSKQMLKSQFWRVLLFLVIIYAIIFSIDIVLLRSNHPVTHITSWMLNLLTTPFLISLKYEVYRHIPYPEKKEIPNNWIFASKIGFVLMIIVVIGFANTMIQTYPTWKEINKQIPKNVDFEKSI